MPNDERPADQESQLDRTEAAGAGRRVERAPLPEDVTRTFERMERLLGRIHGALDASAREGEHREWSSGRLVGGILQVIVAGLVALALLDWLLHGVVSSIFVKLAFAMVLQLSALTAFVVSRKSS
jgi:hypothetical protein